MKRGTKRIVIFCGGFVLKFCRIGPLLNIVEGFWKQGMIKRQWRFALAPINWKWQWFCKGIKKNRTEYKCWKATQAPFLVPVYFGLGILNIQEREYGEQPTWDEMNELVRAIGEKTKEEIYLIDDHCLSPRNFLRNEKGYRIVDYGDSSSRSLTFPQFIVRWQTELKAILCH